MAGAPAHARIEAAVLGIVAALPAGRLSTYADIGRHLDVTAEQVAATLAGLDDTAAATVPWHRVVQAGGAIGRHRRREAQIARLVAEGVVVAPVGIVHDLAARRVDDLAALLSGRALRAEPAAGASRARGVRQQPASTVRATGRPRPG